MRRPLTAYAQRHHWHHQTSGHIGQGRFKAFPVQNDDHLATVLRHVERIPLRAELIARGEHWKWSSLPGRLASDPSLWHGDPTPSDPAWVDRANEPLSVADLQRLRNAVALERPFGGEEWTQRTARALGFESSLRERGRPRKA